MYFVSVHGLSVCTLSPTSDLSQISHCNIKGLPVSCLKFENYSGNLLI